MVVQWFPHYIGASVHEPIGSWQRSSAETVSLARNMFDSLTVPLEFLLDGMGSEAWNSMTPYLWNLCFWPYSPHAFYYTVHHRFNIALPNELQVTASSGFGSDDQTDNFVFLPMLAKDYFKIQTRLKKQSGLQFTASQAECRTAEEHFGGMGYPVNVRPHVHHPWSGHVHHLECW